MICQRCGAENPSGKAACWNCLGPLEGRMAEVRVAEVDVSVKKAGRALKAPKAERREAPPPKPRRERAPAAASVGGGGLPIQQAFIIIVVLVAIAVVLYFAFRPIPHPEREGAQIGRPGAGAPGGDPSELPDLGD